MRTRALALVFGLLSISACVTTKTPSTPSPSGLNLTGTWTGDLAVQGATARMLWALTQTNDTVAGTVTVTLPNGIVLMNGSLNGTVTGTSIPYTISVAPGGIPTQPSCSGQLGGTLIANAAPATALAGTYRVITSTCTPPFASSGDITLRR